MQRLARLTLATALVLGSSGALAQDGDLAGVTMRVLDDLRDVDAVVLELDASRGAAEDDAAAGGDRSENSAPAREERRAERSRDDVARDAAESERRAERRERDSLHDVDADELAEGRLEDRDVPRNTQPPPPPPAP